MGRNHLSRIAAPNSWFLGRKSNKWVTRPSPGPHSLAGCVPLSFVLRNMLNYAKTKKEINKILNDGDLIVDKKVRKGYKFPVGLMDVIEIPKLKEVYRVIYNSAGHLDLVQIAITESPLKLLKVVRKNVIKGGKMQLTFHDGRNILVDKFEGSVGDSALYDFEKRDVVKWLKMENGVLVYLTGGKHIGTFGILKGVIKEEDLQKAKVMVEISSAEYTTLMKYAFIVGKNKSELKLEAGK